MVLDETTGIPSPIQLPLGVVMPTLVTNYAMLQEKWAIRKEFNVDLDTTTKAVQLDVYLKLQKDVAHATSTKFFEEGKVLDGVINTPDGLPAQAQISMDACYMCKGLNCTNIGYKFPAGSIAPNSPLEWKTCCLLEGTDKWASVWKDAKVTIQRFNQLIRGEFEGRKPLTMKWLGGGDMASISSSLGLSGCASPFPCPMCEAPRKDMCADKTIAKGFTKRNVQRIKLLSHTVEGTCPGCRFHIVKEFSKNKQEAKWQMKLAQPGDSQPPVGKLLQGRHLTWQEMHFGVAYGKFPFYDGIEPSDWISCILHLNLRIVGGLATKTIYNQIGKNKAVGEKQEETIANILKSRGIYVRTQSIKPKSSNVTQAKQDFKSHSFSGLDAETLSLVAVELLDVVSPLDVRKSDPVVEANYQHRVKAWKLWEVCWALIKADKFDREAWAVEIENAGAEFITAWVAAVGGATKGVYLHMLQAHIPDLVRRFGNLSKYSSQGLEHTHKMQKRFAPLGTNFKPGQRGRSQLDQMLALEHVAQGVHEVVMQLEFAKDKKDRLARAKRKAKKRSSFESEHAANLAKASNS